MVVAFGGGLRLSASDVLQGMFYVHQGEGEIFEVWAGEAVFQALEGL